MRRSKARSSMLPLWIAGLALALLFPVAATAKKKKDNDKLSHKQEKALLETLDEKYRWWYTSVQLLVTSSEKKAFLELEKDYQRDAFIERFWKERDPFPGSARNEFRDDYEERIAYARQVFGSLTDSRTEVLLMNGAPLARLQPKCDPSFFPLEVWHYKGSDTYAMEFLLLFFQRFGRGDFVLWEPIFGLDVLLDTMPSAAGTTSVIGGPFGDCGPDADAVRAAISFMNSQGGQLGSVTFFQRLLAPRVEPPTEWVATFGAYSTDLPEGAETFDAELQVDFPGRRQSRTITQANVVVPVASLGQSEVGGLKSYNLVLNGEVLREGALHESFRYKFDFPETDVQGEHLPLLFQRYLRPGEYQIVLRVEDMAGKRFHRSEQPLVVPHLEGAPPPPPMDPEVARMLEEANAAIRNGENTIRILPLHGEWQTDLVRIDTMITGDDINRVQFLLDDVPILLKKSPPYNVELDLGDVPRSRVLRVEAQNAEGEELAADELMINAGRHRFAVRLEEPRKGKTYRRSLRAEADVVVPEGEVVERVEFYLNETLVSTLYQPPWIQPIMLPELEPIAYVRAVAYQPNGTSTESLVFVNAPDNLEEIDIEFVELYTLVLDRDNRPVQELTKEDFLISEDEVPQEMVRFELVKNLPIHASIMLDVSASMDEVLPQARDAALGFFQQAITPKDRASVVVFNDHPQLAMEFTNDLDKLAGGLAGLKAERGTALYDSLIYTLYYFNGLKGQRAIVLLSDGKDESSRFEFNDALEYAQRSGVAIYAIGLDLAKREMESRRKLNRFADETGGRAFFIDDIAELPAIYDIIQLELRSRYLLAYQSSNTSGGKRFRSIEVDMVPPGIKAKTLRGYFP